MRTRFFSIVSRTLIILLAAGLVSGGFYLLVGAGFGQRAQARAFGSVDGQVKPPVSGAGIDRFIRGPGDGSGLAPGSANTFGRGLGDGFFWWAGLTGILRNLGLIALITMGVGVLGKLIHWINRRVSHPAPQ